MPVTLKGHTYYDWEPLEAEIKRQLAESAWTQLPDSPLSSGDIATIATWRADLYALLESTADAHTITIPTCSVNWQLSAAGTYGVVPPTYTPD